LIEITLFETFEPNTSEMNPPAIAFHFGLRHP
jgi:hypothetical protein